MFRGIVAGAHMVESTASNSIFGPGGPSQAAGSWVRPRCGSILNHYNVTTYQEGPRGPSCAWYPSVKEL